MKVKADITINSAKEAVWRVITNIENSVNTISAIENIEVLEKPENGLVGLKWQETRTMFGQQATEIMWITEAQENAYYRTRAENNGAVYISELRVEGSGDKTLLSMEFEGEAQSFGAKLMSFLTGFLFKGAREKAIKQDLEDIKVAVEG